MIRYTLVCESSHSFEGWFRNSDDFQSQCERNLVACPTCGGTQIRKALMAPAVSTSRKKAALEEHAPVESDQAGGNAAGAAELRNDAPQSQSQSQSQSLPQVQQAAMLPVDVRQKEIYEALRLVRAKIVETSENVGKDFADEARKMHYGDAAERNIYGQTTLQDAEDLLEEGIAILPLPDLPDEKN